MVWAEAARWRALSTTPHRTAQQTSAQPKAVQTPTHRSGCPQWRGPLPKRMGCHRHGGWTPPPATACRVPAGGTRWACGMWATGRNSWHLLCISQARRHRSPPQLWSSHANSPSTSAPNHHSLPHRHSSASPRNKSSSSSPHSSHSASCRQCQNRAGKVERGWQGGQQAQRWPLDCPHRSTAMPEAAHRSNTGRRCPTPTPPLHPTSAPSINLCS